ncbi:MAG TPA: YfbU family protein [Allosphingosinicella sp.]|nr:YfbU family protein [Allosphingosinicella sp.]
MANEIPDEMFKRMVLANQYRMLARLDSPNADYWQRAAAVAEDLWPVESLPGVARLTEAAASPLTREHQEFVVDILQIYRLLQDAELEGMAAADGRGADFPGFDGNYETKLMGYARHLVEHEQRFTSVRTVSRDYNSHWPTVESYARMIAAWDRQGRPLRLSREQFDELLAERARPIDLAAAIGQ